MDIFLISFLQTCDRFRSYFRTKHKFTKYLKENCGLIKSTFSFKYFQKNTQAKVFRTFQLPINIKMQETIKKIIKKEKLPAYQPYFFELLQETNNFFLGTVGVS